jgi:hypothetical protein
MVRMRFHNPEMMMRKTKFCSMPLINPRVNVKPTNTNHRIVATIRSARRVDSVTRMIV